jgi:membrane protease YdiL (CAAX protease family)
MLTYHPPTISGAARWGRVATSPTMVAAETAAERVAPLALQVAVTAVSWSPFAVLLVAAAVRTTRRVVLVYLFAGLGAAVVADGCRPDPATRRALPWASTVPVALCFAWGTIPEPAIRPALGSCTDPLSPPATWRAIEAVLVLGVSGVLVRFGGRDALLLRGPTDRRVAALAVIAPVSVAPAILAGPSVAGLFFGAAGVVFPPGSFVPAALLAVANGTLEEVAYRGALMGWGGRAIGPRRALLVQAAVFGFAHWGPGMTGAMPLLIFVSLGACGLAIGQIARRTGSLLLPVSVHAAVDVPLYHLAACSLA